MLQLDHQPRLQGLGLSKMGGKGLGRVSQPRNINYACPALFETLFLKEIQENLRK